MAAQGTARCQPRRFCSRTALLAPKLLTVIFNNIASFFQSDWEMERGSFWFLRCSRSWQTTGEMSLGLKVSPYYQPKLNLHAETWASFCAYGCILLEMIKLTSLMGEELQNSLILLNKNHCLMQWTQGLEADKDNSWRNALCSLGKNLSHTNSLQFLPLASVGPRYDFFSQAQTKKDVKVGTITFMGHSPLLWGLIDRITPLTSGFAQPWLQQQKTPSC